MPERFVDLGPDGKLVYETDSRGNRVPDFSYAGYQGGGVALPTPPASVTLTPVPGDNTAHVQAAFDKGGVIQLAPGRYKIAGQAPEIDGHVFLSLGERASELSLRPGDLVTARVTGSAEYDLAAEVLRVVQPAYRPPQALKLRVLR